MWTQRRTSLHRSPAHLLAGRRERRHSPACRSLLLAIGGVLLTSPAPSAAQGWVEAWHGPSGAWVERTRSEVRAEVAGRVAHFVVDEWFMAHGQRLGEADYLFPLPAGAVFESFSLYEGEEELRGEVMDAEKARAIYEAIVRKRRDPALIEMAGTGLFRARIFPLEPGEERRVTLRFTQVLERAGDALQLRYAAGPGPASACPRGGSAPPPDCLSRAPATHLEIRVAEGDRFLEPFSPTHAVSVERIGSSLRVSAEGPLAGAFSLFLPLARAGLGLTLVTHRPVGEDGYFMLSLSPGRVEGPQPPRDVTVALDVSGSMSGEKLRQAQSALLDLLATLDERDRFRLITFSNAVRSHSLEWMRAGERELEAAREWVAGLEANGGTNIGAALKEAFRLSSPPERLPVVLFLTDGLPTVGETSVEAILRSVAERRGRARVFSFGVGHDVNTALLDALASEGRGSTSYVEPGESVERALSLLAGKIQHPVLTDLALEEAPVRLREIYPVEIPDVFAGEELVLLGRYEAGSTGTTGALVLTGRRGGESARFELEAAFPGRADANDFLPRLWASRKLGFLTRRVWTEGAGEELVEEIRETALRYGLPSPYTSYLVQESAEGFRPLVDMVARGAPGRPVAGVYTEEAPVVGTGAVRRAKEAKALRGVASEAQLEALDQAVRALIPEGVEDLRAVGGRLFRNEDGVWKDIEPAAGTKVLAVAPFSKAYFELLRLLPELRPYGSAFEQVEIQGLGLRIRFAEGGRETLSAAEIGAAVQAFRQREGGRR